MTAWVYIRSDPKLWTVGFYGPADEWNTDSDHSTREDAAKRVHYLNGGAGQCSELLQAAKAAMMFINDTSYPELAREARTNLETAVIKHEGLSI